MTSFQPVALESGAPRAGSVHSVASAVRIHQWVKNVLVFAPLLAGHRVTEASLVGRSVLAFAAFCLAASSGYLINDVRDIGRDRAHPTKRRRAVAAGALTPRVAGTLAAALICVALALGAWLGPVFLIHLAGYWVLSVGYTAFARRVAILDVLTLAALYTIRVFSGSVATSIPVSNWLLAFSGFLFVSLAFLKRVAELRRLGADAVSAGRAYVATDESTVVALGTSAGNVAVLVLALYVNAEAATSLYARPHLLWLVCPVLLYWLSRAWLLACRGLMHDDPVVFAVRDRASWWAATVAAAIAMVAT